MSVLVPAHILSVNAAIIRPGVGSGLQLWYRFSDGLDSIATDSSGRNRNGTLTAMDTTDSWIPGPRGRALLFDGVDGFVNTGSLGSTTNTVSFWIKATSSMTQNILDLNGTAYVTMTSGTLTATGFTSPTIYVNGVVSSVVSTSTWNHVTITTGTAINATAITIGKRSTNFFAGGLDEIRFFNRALSATEVLTLYRGAFTRVDTSKVSSVNMPLINRLVDSSLIGYWTLNSNDFTSTTTAINRGASSTLMNATYFGTTSVRFAPGKNGQGLFFPETGAAFNTNYGSGINPTLQPMTVSFWVRKMDTCTDSQDHVFGWGQTGVNTRMYIRCGNSTTNRYGFRLAGNAEVFVPTTIVLGEWTHVAVTLNGTTGLLYVNASSSATSTYASYVLGGNMYFGNLNENTTALTQGANAVMDEIRIYKRALSPREIAELYNMGK